MPLTNAITLRPVTRSAASRKSPSRACWKNMRVSRRRWCSPIATMDCSAGVSVRSRLQMTCPGPRVRPGASGAAAEQLLVEPNHLVRELERDVVAGVRHRANVLPRASRLAPPMLLPYSGKSSYRTSPSVSAIASISICSSGRPRAVTPTIVSAGQGRVKYLARSSTILGKFAMSVR